MGMRLFRAALLFLLVGWCLWLTHWALDMSITLDEYEYRVGEVERLSPLVVDSLREVVQTNNNALEKLRGGETNENTSDDE